MALLLIQCSSEMLINAFVASKLGRFDYKEKKKPTILKITNLIGNCLILKFQGVYSCEKFSRGRMTKNS